ncbi:MAG: hypothetical protein SchgKO_20890 [Schleiferiaceae bacterium]
MKSLTRFSLFGLLPIILCATSCSNSVADNNDLFEIEGRLGLSSENLSVEERLANINSSLKNERFELSVLGEGMEREDTIAVGETSVIRFDVRRVARREKQMAIFMNEDTSWVLQFDPKEQAHYLKITPEQPGSLKGGVVVLHNNGQDTAKTGVELFFVDDKN